MISVFRSGRVPQPRAIDPIHLHVRVPPSGPPRPEPPIDSDSGIRIRSASGLVLAGVVVLAMAALVTVAVAAPAIDPEPDDKPAVVAAPLPQNVKDVQPGQVARISLAAYDPSRYGVIMGEVRRVAKNTTQPENAMPFYETIIAIPDVAFTKSPDTPVITAGMPLQVDILGGKRTIMNYIMTPIQKSLATAFREK